MPPAKSPLRLPRIPGKDEDLVFNAESPKKPISRTKSNNTLSLYTAWKERFAELGAGEEASAQVSGLTRGQRKEMELTKLRQSNPELLERRKVLAQSAFVSRMSGSGVEQSAHGAQKKQEVMAIMDELKTMPPSLRKNLESLDPGAFCSLNGIGHPLMNDRALVMTKNPTVFFHAAYRAAELAFQMGQNAIPKLIPMMSKPGLGSLLLAGPAWDSAGNVVPQSLKDAPPANASTSKPLSNDTLNLWNGKRLTRAEMKIEQRLHVLRNNPGAKKDLVKRVMARLERSRHSQASVA
eukprot:gene9841-7727_t